MSEGRLTQFAEHPVVKRPDEMGIWSDGGDIIWLDRDQYPKRYDAIKFALEHWCCDFIDVRCVVRWMRYEPFVAHKLDGSVAWSEDQWYECEKDEPGAFKVWRLEG